MSKQAAFDGPSCGSDCGCHGCSEDDPLGLVESLSQEPPPDGFDTVPGDHPEVCATCSGPVRPAAHACHDIECAAATSGSNVREIGHAGPAFARLGASEFESYLDEFFEVALDSVRLAAQTHELSPHVSLGVDTESLHRTAISDTFHDFMGRLPEEVGTSSVFLELTSMINRKRPSNVYEMADVMTHAFAADPTLFPNPAAFVSASMSQFVDVPVHPYYGESGPPLCTEVEAPVLVFCDDAGCKETGGVCIPVFVPFKYIAGEEWKGDDWDFLGCSCDPPLPDPEPWPDPYPVPVVVRVPAPEYVSQPSESTWERWLRRIGEMMDDIPSWVYWVAVAVLVAALLYMILQMPAMAPFAPQLLKAVGLSVGL